MVIREGIIQLFLGVLVNGLILQFQAAAGAASVATMSLMVLMDLKSHLHGSALDELWRPVPSAGNQSSTSTYCRWSGVRCDSRGRGRVVGLTLPALGLQGSIAPSLSNLTTLRSLDLSQNVLTGPIPTNFPASLKFLSLSQNHLSGPIPPSSVSNLWLLQELDLNMNWLTGSIPAQLSNCTQLQHLNLAQNNLSGHIPAYLSNLPSLQTLLLWFNMLSGTLPPSLSNCSQLIQMEISMNYRLSGPIPAEYGQFQNLLILRLFDNSLSGTLPPSLSNCTQLLDLSLFSNDMSGHIPGMLGGFTYLQTLYLYNNSFTGPIPAQLSNCTSLQLADLSMNGLTGPIPQELGAISFTVQPDQVMINPAGTPGYLSLRNNALSGGIPTTLGNCSGLGSLYLNFNPLQGRIPDEIGNLATLQFLSLTGNQLTGSIPVFLGQLTRLQELLLNFNHLNGNIPESLTNLTLLQKLDLGRNQLVGTLPYSLGSLAQLESLALLDNKLCGSIPLSISNGSKLQRLELNINRLNGSLPPIIRMPHLQVLNLSHNQFTGHLPEEFANATAMYSLCIAQNFITGFIPKVFGDLLSLQLLDLHGNQLAGPIPSELGRLSQLYELDLQGNRLQGRLPNELGQLLSLRHLYLQWNALEGDIPPSLGNCLDMEDINLSGNNFNGSIPSSLARISSLKLNFILSHNLLSGQIPNEVQELKSVQSIDFSFNKLSGGIPTTFSGCTSLQRLSLSHNRLDGAIPRELGDLQSLAFLDLSNNDLSGNIPDTLGAIPTLHFLNASHNHLTGPIPQTATFRNLTASSFAYNTGLCGRPLPLTCPEPLQHPVARKMPRLVLTAIICGMLGMMLLLALCIVVFLWYRKRSPFSKAAKHRFFLNKDPLRSLSLRVKVEELYIATRGFDERNLVGRGATSKVYKAVMKSGRVVAVKKFDLERNSDEAESYFRKECETLGQVRHRNLVSILSTCCNLDMKALVLEYMPNGSLEKLLFAREGFYLDWQRVLSIALDVGQALEYLHTECQAPIIHCDLKPSNILLDEAFTAHVSDFGIAQLLSPDTTTYSTSCFRGSIGYTAPECAQLCHYSAKGDVYSYGVVLLCMLTRRQPTSAFFGDMGIDMPTWARTAFRATFLDALDATLRAEVEASGYRTEVLQFLELALLCTSQDPADRPTSKQVVQRLLQIIRAYKRVSASSSSNRDLRERRSGSDSISSS